MEGLPSSDQGRTDLDILVVTAGADGFRQALGKRFSNARDDSFTIALVYRSLDEEASMHAWRCDFMAVTSETILVTPGPQLLRRRAGHIKDWSAAVLDGRCLFDSGLAALLLADADPQHARARVAAHAETLLALKQSRPFSCPDW